jgi:hypothetical protein
LNAVEFHRTWLAQPSNRFERWQQLIGMSLAQKIIDFLAQADAKPAPSKLEPYADLNREQVAALCLEDFSVHWTTLRADRPHPCPF